MTAFKLLVLGVLVAIVASLFTALFSLMRDRGRSNSTVRALTVRVALSVGLFVLLLIGMKLGLVAPHGVYPATPTQAAPPAPK